MKHKFGLRNDLSLTENDWREEDVEEEICGEAGEVDESVVGVVRGIVLLPRVHDQPDDDPHYDQHT